VKKSPRIGFLLAPLATPVASALWILFVGADPAQKDSHWITESVTAWVGVLGSAALFSYAASVLLGVPLILVLRRVDRLSFWTVVSAAAPLGAVALLAVFFGTGGYFETHVWPSSGKLAGGGAMLGIFVAASYCWLVGIGGRKTRVGRNESFNPQRTGIDPPAG